MVERALVNIGQSMARESSMRATPVQEIIDADGHVWEDNRVEDFIEPPYHGHKSILGGLFPTIDVLHNEPVQMLPGSLDRSVGPGEWKIFLDQLGIKRTILYAGRGLAICNA